VPVLFKRLTQKFKKTAQLQHISLQVRNPRCLLPKLLIFIVEQNLVGMNAVVRRLGIHMKQGPLYENVALSTKPEVHNVSQRRQRSTEP